MIIVTITSPDGTTTTSTFATREAAIRFSQAEVSFDCRRKVGLLEDNGPEFTLDANVAQHAADYAVRQAGILWVKRPQAVAATFAGMNRGDDTELVKTALRKYDKVIAANKWEGGYA